MSRQPLEQDGGLLLESWVRLVVPEAALRRGERRFGHADVRQSGDLLRCRAEDLGGGLAEVAERRVANRHLLAEALDRLAMPLDDLIRPFRRSSSEPRPNSSSCSRRARRPLEFAERPDRVVLSGLLVPTCFTLLMVRGSQAGIRNQASAHPTAHRTPDFSPELRAPDETREPLPEAGSPGSPASIRASQVRILPPALLIDLLVRKPAAYQPPCAPHARGSPASRAGCARRPLPGRGTRAAPGSAGGRRSCSS